MKRSVRRMILLALAALAPACDGGGGGGGVGGTFTIRGVGGRAAGSSVSNTCFGGTGAGCIIQSGGPFKSGVNPAPKKLKVPSVPSSTASLSTPITTLSADQTVPSGNAFLTGTVTATGAATRTITCDEGDIVISGTLLAGKDAGAQIGLVISAPNGTVYVTGAIRTTSQDGVADGDAAGGVLINAHRIVVTGTIEAIGENDPNNITGIGGAGGTVGLLAINPSDTDVIITGSIKASGGSGASDAKGANGGSVLIGATGEVQFRGAIVSSGGNCAGSSLDAAVAGNAGMVQIQGGVAAVVDGRITLNGGDVETTGEGAKAGTGGTLQINGSVDGPVWLYGSFTANGGVAQAGSGTVSAPITAGSGSHAGDVIVDGSFTGLGGDCDVVPTHGGGFVAVQGGGATGGDVVVRATVNMTGGSSSASSSTNTPGGIGGLVSAPIVDTCAFLVGTFGSAGRVTLLPGTSVVANGGRPRRHGRHGRLLLCPR